MGNICCGGDAEEYKNGPFGTPDDESCGGVPCEDDGVDKDYDATTSAREEKILQHGRALFRRTITSTPVEIAADYVCPSYPKSDEALAFLNEALKDNFVFDNMEESTKAQLMNAMQMEEFEEGTYIIRQGDIGDFFYVVEEGNVSFVVNGATVGGQGKGCSFGELALLYNTPRAASVVATKPCKAWKVDQTTFRSVLAAKELNDGQQVQKTLENVPFVKGLSDAMKAKLTDALTSVEFNEGDRIMNKGDEGKLFYIVKSGEVRVHDIGHGQSTFEDQLLSSGDYLGERALLTGEPRAANATAASDCTMLAISRDTFEGIIGPLDVAMEASNCAKFLKSIPSLAPLLSSEIDALAALRKEIKVEAGSLISNTCENLFVVKKGRVILTTKDESLVKLKGGDYFGNVKEEKESLGEFRADEDLTCYIFSKETVKGVICDLSRLSENKDYSAKGKSIELKLKDIKKHRILGMGAFGKVWLVSSLKDKSSVYALKMVSKRQLLATHQAKAIVREKMVMETVYHPLLLNMVSSFQDPNYLYFVLQVVPGGELFDIVHTDAGSGLPVDSARFYSACVIEAFAYLHTRHIVYRDLKPENVLVDNDGYCIVIDFGFAKVVTDKTYTMCGTPEYIAPEIIVSKGHNHMADLWSYGCMLYELVAGETPFFNAYIDEMTLMKNICKGDFKFPTGDKALPDDCKDLVSRLLVPKPAERVGNLALGTHDITGHPWFESIDFAELRDKKIKAPWKPVIKNPLDSSNFTNDYSKEEKQVDRFNKKLSSKDQAAFKNF